MVEDIFKARADSFGETMIGGSGTISFKLPEGIYLSVQAPFRPQSNCVSL